MKNASQPAAIALSIVSLARKVRLAEYAEAEATQRARSTRVILEAASDQWNIDWIAFPNFENATAVLADSRAALDAAEANYSAGVQALYAR